jgi:hypothetical protein
MRRLLPIVALVACLAPGLARAGSLTSAPVEDLGLPFWCDWGYDWDERCYTDNTGRLPIGGLDDKEWRAALRFSLDGLPGGAWVKSARLDLYFDGACVAPRRRAGPCLSGEYVVDAHRIRSASWTKEREVDFDPSLAAETGVVTDYADWSSWDLTALVRDWVSGAAPNRGVLLQLIDAEEGFGVGGPYFPSSSFPDTAVRPRLVVEFVPSTTGPAP